MILVRIDDEDAGRLLLVDHRTEPGLVRAIRERFVHLPDLTVGQVKRIHQAGEEDPLVGGLGRLLELPALVLARHRGIVQPVLDRVEVHRSELFPQAGRGRQVFVVAVQERKRQK